MKMAAQSRTASVGSAPGPLFQSKGGSVCRRHHILASNKTPARVDALAGVRIRTAEAVQTLQSHYPAFGCGSQEEIHHDLPQLPDRMPPIREA